VHGYSYNGTLTENVILVVEHTGLRTFPPELAETGGTCGFAAVEATICCYPREARDYVITGVRLSVCLSVTTITK